MENQRDQSLAKSRVTQTDVIPGAIKPRHFELGTAPIKFGVAENRPDNGSIYPIFFATDTNVLSIWNGSAWVSSTFS